VTPTTLVRKELEGGDVELSDPSRLPAEPLVSVWMITYNHAPYIREALDSVLMQNVDFSYEICLGEDGSTDGTREICLEYAEKHPDKFRLFLRDRSNLARQRYLVPFMHNGVETWNACRGKYIAMLEGDDYWMCSRKLHRQVMLMDADSDASVCAHYAVRASERRPWESYMAPFGPISHFDLETLLRDLLVLATSSFMFRRSCNMDWSKFTDSPCGDTVLLFWHLLKGTGVVSPQVMSVYRMNEGGVFAYRSGLAKARHARATWELLGPLTPSASTEAYQVGYAKTLNGLIGELRRASQYREAIMCFRDALGVIGALRDISVRERASFLFGATGNLLAPRWHYLYTRLIGKLRARRAKAVAS
jgi:glycosyltransferase involved in cell wall biosynthesis